MCRICLCQVSLHGPDAKCVRSCATRYHADGRVSCLHVLTRCQMRTVVYCTSRLFGRLSFGSRSPKSICHRMKALGDVENKDEVLQWVETCRKWKDALRNNTSQDNLVRISKILTGDAKKKNKAVLAEDVITAIGNLKRTPSALPSESSAVSSSDILHAPPAKMPKKSAAPSPATPQPMRGRSRSRSARRCAETTTNEEALTPARTPRAAEALAMSARKSEAASPANLLMSSPIVSTTSISSSRGDVNSNLLVEAAGARPRIRDLVKALKEIQSDKNHAVWPQSTGAQKNLYQKLHRARTEYNQALHGEIDNPFATDDLRLLFYFVGSGSDGPHDRALGKNTLGSHGRGSASPHRVSAKSGESTLFGRAHLELVSAVCVHGFSGEEHEAHKVTVTPTVFTQPRARPSDSQPSKLIGLPHKYCVDHTIIDGGLGQYII